MKKILSKMFKSFSVILFFACCFTITANAQSKDFQITIQREEKKNKLVIGTISVNGEGIGTAYENDDLKIPAGTYKGLLRYWSGKGFAQGPFGTYGQKGDFLLEVSGVKGRTHILFHGGNKPHHSLGCILLGPVNKDASGVRFLDENHPLVKLRNLFYGTDVPNSTPDKNITVNVVDIGETEGLPVNPNAKCISEKCKEYKALRHKLALLEKEIIKKCETFKAGTQQYIDCLAAGNKKYQELQNEVDSVFNGDEDGLYDCDEAENGPVCNSSTRRDL